MYYRTYWAAMNLYTAEQCNHKHEQERAAKRCAADLTRTTGEPWTAVQITPPTLQAVR